MTQPRIAIDFGGTHIRFASLAAGLRDVKVVPSRADLPCGELKAYFLDALEAYLGETGIRGQVASVNVAIAGQIDHLAGVVLASPNVPSWAGAPLKHWIADRFHVPVYVDNDVRAAALGELSSPALAGTRDLVCLYWGTGIGGGVVCDGKLLRGVSNAAGEVGHTVYVPGGLPCHCGKRGCFEAYAGGWAIPRAAELAARAAGVAGFGPGLTTADVFALAEQGNAVAVSVRDEAARTLGVLAANLVITFNPGVLVLGGGMVQRYPAVAYWVERSIEENALPVDRPGFRLHVSALGDSAALWGAVMLGESL